MRNRLWSTSAATRALKSRIVNCSTVREALGLVEAGQVAAGIVYRSDAWLSKRVRVVDVFPEAVARADRFPDRGPAGGPSRGRGPRPIPDGPGGRRDPGILRLRRWRMEWPGRQPLATHSRACSPGSSLAADGGGMGNDSHVHEGGGRLCRRAGNPRHPAGVSACAKRLPREGGDRDARPRAARGPAGGDGVSAAGSAGQQRARGPVALSGSSASSWPSRSMGPSSPRR